MEIWKKNPKHKKNSICLVNLILLVNTRKKTLIVTIFKNNEEDLRPGFKPWGFTKGV